MDKNWKDIKENWVVKPRTYMLKGEATPPLRQIRAKHKYDNHLLFWDDAMKENREIRYVAGSKTPFVDEQPSENVRIQQIFFKDGILSVGSKKVALQQFLEIHPDNGRVFFEVKPEETAEEQNENYELKAKAYEIITQGDADKVASLMYAQIGEEALRTSTKELRRDLYVLADFDADTVVSMDEDEKITLKYIAAKAIKFNVLKTDGATVKWAKNGRKVITVPVDEGSVGALANFFLTDDGIPVKAKVLELLEDY